MWQSDTQRDLVMLNAPTVAFEKQQELLETAKD
jgi:hypothetical protein